jgi:hypothetical protein
MVIVSVNKHFNDQALDVLAAKYWDALVTCFLILKIEV